MRAVVVEAVSHQTDRVIDAAAAVDVVRPQVGDPTSVLSAAIMIVTLRTA
jgi:hypothetical protein